MIQKLLQRFGALPKQADQNGWTPLHLATCRGSDESVKLLLESDRQVAYMKDAKGRTALHAAAYGGNLSAMLLIISSCPDCCELVDKRGRNVLHFIIESPWATKENMKAVLKNPSLSKLLYEKDFDGNTPLHHQFNMEDIKENFIDHSRVDKMALNKQNLTAYDCALSGARLKLAAKLLLRYLEGSKEETINVQALQLIWNMVDLA
ncbi:hypothetical protein CJ030_MR0G002913 [Morella rubra]|uniref:Uncharacterized protein n=1 Tax=Morella rubra TaxID=262757 RepID=A0A6A1UN29_9ROSI|nr:hypothetical protein CJ030_MR0G002913 [Morella rubra]